MAAAPRPFVASISLAAWEWPCHRPPGMNKGTDKIPGASTQPQPTYEATAAVYCHGVQRVVDPEQHHCGGDDKVEDGGEDGHKASRGGQVQVTSPTHSNLEEHWAYWHHMA